MSKLSKEEQARRETMAYCLRVVKESGIEGLEQDIKMRGITNCPVGLCRQTARQYEDEVKNNTLDTVLILTCCVLQDEFDFENKRLQRFIDRFNLKSEVLSGGYGTWNDMIAQLLEANIHLKIRNQGNIMKVETGDNDGKT